MNERGISGSDGSRGARRDASMTRMPPWVRVKRNLRRATKQGDADSAMIAAGGADTKCLSE